MDEFPADNMQNIHEMMARLVAELESLSRFKAWVHGFLTAAGVPPDPDPEHTKRTGCRISGRMRWLAERADVTVTPGWDEWIHTVVSLDPTWDDNGTVPVRTEVRNAWGQENPK